MQGSEFAELNAFLAVAEARSFARGARKLGLAPSTVSQTIRMLEERLGVRLLNRTTRSVALTDAGERLLLRLRPAVMELKAAVEDLNAFRDTPTGTLRLTVSSVAARVVLAPLMKSFLEAFPAITLDITMEDDVTEPLGGDADAGIRVGRLVAKNMQVVQVSEPAKLIVVAAPDYIARHGTPKTPQDLERHNCIRLRNEMGHVAWDFAKGRHHIEMLVQGSLVVNNMSLLMQAVRQGIGLGYTLESYVREDLAKGSLVALLSDWAPQPQTYYLYYPKRQQQPVPLSVFMAFLESARDGKAGPPA
ncbi:MAG: LysR family transcriptional regulator [Alphaproteobacteria bacterium]|nr:LysR family transcriptional regulator [Alphaproteobacteria bacterium]